MSSLTEQIKDPAQAKRLAQYALDENPNMEDFEDFEQAFLKAFNTPTGQNLKNFLNTEESIMLFKTPIIQEAIKNNVGEEEYEEVEKETKDFHVIRAVPKGEKTRKRDIVIIKTSKPVKTKTYLRNNLTIKSYSRGYSKWTPAQEKYIISQKAKKLPTRQLLANYNNQFKENQRSPSSIKTKLYRV
jgi:hypothetical protein